MAMNLRKKECQQQNINRDMEKARSPAGLPASKVADKKRKRKYNILRGCMKKGRYGRDDRYNKYGRYGAKTVGKENGQIGWTLGLFLVLFLGIFLCALLQIDLYRTASLYLEDALAASNLASAVVDIKEYGESHKILIKDFQEAYERYQQAVKGNLNLSDSWEGQTGGVIQGSVRIINYTIYNVDGNDVTVYCYNENGSMTSWTDVLGSTLAPNGKVIESTSIYSEIAFMVKGMFGIEVQAYKGNLADIAR